MKFEIIEIGRTVELTDEIVNEYEKFDKLRGGTLALSVLSVFRHDPTEEEITDEDLSKLCDKVLISRLKLFSLLPRTIT